MNNQPKIQTKMIQSKPVKAYYITKEFFNYLDNIRKEKLAQLGWSKCLFYNIDTNEMKTVIHNGRNCMEDTLQLNEILINEWGIKIHSFVGITNLKLTTRWLVKNKRDIFDQYTGEEFKKDFRIFTNIEENILNFSNFDPEDYLVEISKEYAPKSFWDKFK